MKNPHEFSAMHSQFIYPKPITYQKNIFMLNSTLNFSATQLPKNRNIKVIPHLRRESALDARRTNYLTCVGGLGGRLTYFCASAIIVDLFVSRGTGIWELVFMLDLGNTL